MRKIIIPTTFFSFLLGCATTSHLDFTLDKKHTPPETQFLKKWKKSSVADLEKIPVGVNEDNIRWWKTYSIAKAQAKNQTQTSCKLFASLSEEKYFPLQDLALLKAYEVCPKGTLLKKLPITPSSWQKNLLAEMRLKEARQSTSPQEKLAALVEIAKLENNKKTKEDVLKEALAIAESIKLQPEVQTIKDSLFKNSPRLNPQPKFSDLSNIGSDYRFYRKFDEAVKIYSQILESKEATIEDQFQALKNIRQTYKVAQKKEAYIKASEELAKWTDVQLTNGKKDLKALNRYHDAHVILARTLWTEDQTSKALELLKTAQIKLEKRYSLEEIYFIQGRIHEEKGQLNEALKMYELAYQEPSNSYGLKDKIVWLKSWNYFKAEKWDSARDSLIQMRTIVKDTSDKLRAQFWLARCYKKLNQDSLSNLELDQLIKEDPLGYYGVLASRELRRPLSKINSQFQETQSLTLLNLKTADPDQRLLAEWLIALDEKKPAEQVLKDMADNLRSNHIADEDSWLIISSAYARTGLYLPLFATLNAMQPEIKDHLLNNHPDLLFPQDFSDIIQTAAIESGTPQEFIYSIIRQESAFNPEARSAADAFGLMQLLPEVAEKIARTNNLKYQEASDLFNPDINIPLGARELKNLMKKYDNQFILAVSGYNANEAAIRGWLNTRLRPDPIEFIEEIPYEETKAYVKLVLRNYVFYKRMLSESQTTVFPEDLLVLKPI